jgi:hypothetical protein
MSETRPRLSSRLGSRRRWTSSLSSVGEEPAERPWRPSLVPEGKHAELLVGRRPVTAASLELPPSTPVRVFNRSTASRAREGRLSTAASLPVFVREENPPEELFRRTQDVPGVSRSKSPVRSSVRRPITASDLDAILAHELPPVAASDGTLHRVTTPAPSVGGRAVPGFPSLRHELDLRASRTQAELAFLSPPLAEALSTLAGACRRVTVESSGHHGHVFSTGVTKLDAQLSSLSRDEAARLDPPPKSREALHQLLVTAVALAQLQWKRSDLALSEVESEVSVSNALVGSSLHSARVGEGQAVQGLHSIVTSLWRAICEMEQRMVELLSQLRAARSSREQIESEIASSLHEELQDTVTSWSTKFMEEQVRASKAENDLEHLREAMDVLRDAVQGRVTPLQAADLIMEAQAAREAAAASETAREDADRALLGMERKLASMRSEDEQLQSRVHALEADVESLERELQEQRELASRAQEQLLLLQHQQRQQQGEEASQESEEEEEELTTPIAMVSDQFEPQPTKQSATTTAAASPRKPKRQAHRVPCGLYRGLLPALGSLPRPPLKRPRPWIRWCFRALLCAKYKADRLAIRACNPPPRWPEFVYTWFDDAAPVCVAAAAGLRIPQSLIVREHLVAKRSGFLTDADLRRWAFYYGVREWSVSSPEGRLALCLLDETAGVEGARWAVFCVSELRVGDGTHPPMSWGPGPGDCDYHCMPAFVDALDAEDEGEIQSIKANEDQHRRSRRRFEPDECLLLSTQTRATIGEADPAGEGSDSDDGLSDGEGAADELEACWSASPLNVTRSARRAPPKSRGSSRESQASEMKESEDDQLDALEVELLGAPEVLRAAASVLRASVAPPKALKQAMVGLPPETSLPWLRDIAQSAARLMSCGLIPDTVRGAVAGDMAERLHKRGVISSRRSRKRFAPRRVWLPLRSALAAMCRCLRYVSSEDRNQAVSSVACMARSATGRLPEALVLEEAPGVVAATSGGEQKKSLSELTELKGAGGHEQVMRMAIEPLPQAETARSTGFTIPDLKPTVETEVPASAVTSPDKTPRVTTAFVGASRRRTKLLTVASAMLAGPSKSMTHKDTFCVDLFEVVAVLMESLRKQQQLRTDRLTEFIRALVESDPTSVRQSLASDDVTDETMRADVVFSSTQLVTRAPVKGYWAERLPPPWTPDHEAMRPDVGVSNQREALLELLQDLKKSSSSWSRVRAVYVGDVRLTDPVWASRLILTLIPDLPLASVAEVRRYALDLAPDGAPSVLDLMRAVNSLGLSAGTYGIRIPEPLMEGELDGRLLLRQAFQGLTTSSNGAIALTSSSTAHRSDVMETMRIAASEASSEIEGQFGWVARGSVGVQPHPPAACAPILPLQPSWGWSDTQAALAVDVVKVRMAALERDLEVWLGPIPAYRSHRPKQRRPSVLGQLRAHPAPAGPLESLTDVASNVAAAGMQASVGSIASLAASSLTDPGAGIPGLAELSRPQWRWSLPFVDQVSRVRLQRARLAVHRSLREATDSSISADFGPSVVGGGASGDGRPALRAYLRLLRELHQARCDALEQCGLVGAAWGAHRVAGPLELAQQEMDALEGILRRDAPSLALLGLHDAPFRFKDSTPSGSHPSLERFLGADRAMLRMSMNAEAPSWPVVARGTGVASGGADLVTVSPAMPGIKPRGHAGFAAAMMSSEWRSAAASGYRGDFATANLVEAVPAALTSRSVGAILRARVAANAIRIQRFWRAGSCNWTMGLPLTSRGSLRPVVAALGVPKRAFFWVPAAGVLTTAAHQEIQRHEAQTSGRTIVTAGPTVATAIRHCGWLCCPAPGDPLTHSILARLAVIRARDASKFAAGGSTKKTAAGLDPSGDQACAAFGWLSGRPLRLVLAALVTNFAISSASTPPPSALSGLAHAASAIVQAVTLLSTPSSPPPHPSGHAGPRSSDQLRFLAKSLQSTVRDHLQPQESPLARFTRETMEGLVGDSEAGAALWLSIVSGIQRACGRRGKWASNTVMYPSRVNEDSKDDDDHEEQQSDDEEREEMEDDEEERDATDDAECVGSAAFARCVGGTMGLASAAFGGRRWGFVIPGIDALPSAVCGLLRSAGCMQEASEGQGKLRLAREMPWRGTGSAVFVAQRLGDDGDAGSKSRIDALCSIMRSERACQVLLNAAGAVSAAATERSQSVAGGGDAHHIASIALLGDSCLARVSLAQSLRVARPLAAHLNPSTAALLAWRLLTPPDMALYEDAAPNPPPFPVKLSAAIASENRTSWLFDEAACSRVETGTADAGWVIWCLFRAWVEDSLWRVLQARATLEQIASSSSQGQGDLTPDDVFLALQAAWGASPPPVALPTAKKHPAGHPEAEDTMTLLGPIDPGLDAVVDSAMLAKVLHDGPGATSGVHLLTAARVTMQEARRSGGKPWNSPLSGLAWPSGSLLQSPILVVRRGVGDVTALALGGDGHVQGHNSSSMITSDPLIDAEGGDDGDSVRTDAADDRRDEHLSWTIDHAERRLTLDEEVAHWRARLAGFLPFAVPARGYSTPPTADKAIESHPSLTTERSHLASCILHVLIRGGMLSVDPGHVLPPTAFSHSSNPVAKACQDAATSAHWIQRLLTSGEARGAPPPEADDVSGSLHLRVMILAQTALLQAFWGRHSQRASDDASHGEAALSGDAPVSEEDVDPEGHWRTRRADEADIEQAIKLGKVIEQLVGTEDQLCTEWVGFDSGMGSHIADEEGVGEGSVELARAVTERVRSVFVDAVNALEQPEGFDPQLCDWSKRLTSAAQVVALSREAIVTWRHLRISGAFLRLRPRPGITEITG